MSDHKLKSIEFLSQSQNKYLRKVNHVDIALAGPCLPHIQKLHSQVSQEVKLRASNLHLTPFLLVEKMKLKERLCGLSCK